MNEIHQRQIKSYGWRPSPPDYEDRKFKSTYVRPILAPPPFVDLRIACPPIYDQGALGSCTANAIAAVVDYEHHEAEGVFINPSRLFIYYGERQIEDSIDYDSGANIRDGIKVVNKMGCPPESAWPYDINKFTVPPPSDVYTAALADMVREYSSVNLPDLHECMICLAAKDPFVFGFSVYENFESDVVTGTGIMDMPQGRQIGGHAVAAVGYFTNGSHGQVPNHSSGGYFLVRNSWGAGWGIGGHFLMPFGYLTNPDLCADAWHMSRVGYGPLVA